MSRDRVPTLRIQTIEPFHAMNLMARARALDASGIDVIHMEVGEPDFPTPPRVLVAARELMQHGNITYTPAAGIPALREAISSYYATRYGVSIPSRRILITPGGSGALLLAAALVTNPGESVITADPGYPCNRNFFRFIGAGTTPVITSAHDRWQLTPGAVRDAWTDTTRGILIGSPSNPTGTLVPNDALSAICLDAHRRGGRVIVDEIYHGLTFGEDAGTALALDDSAIVVNSFSKYFGMTGWRLGWVVGTEEDVRLMERAAQNLFLSPSMPAQMAALAAFHPGTIAELDARRDEFRRRRDLLIPAVESLGFSVPVPPDGAFYVWADASGVTDDVFSFCSDLLESAHVAITPGRDFSENLTSWVRFAFTTSADRLLEGVERIRQYLRHA